MSAGNVPEFVIVSDDQSCDSTVHAAVTDKSGIQKLLTLSEVSSMQKELPTEPASKKLRRKGQKAEKIPCGVCNKAFVSEKSVERHRKTVHSNKEEIGSSEDPAISSVSETNRDNILVKDSNVVASLAEELKNLTAKRDKKKESSQAKRKHECGECGKTFVTPSMLRRHSVVHSGEKPYECLICGNKYSQSERLKRHMGSHTGINIFTCKACGKRFPEKCRYIDHVRSHLEQKPFECDVCSKSFTNRVGLWKHKSIHSGDKKYYGTSCCAYRFKCTECGKEFRQKQDLTRHQRTHTGETPEKTLKCTICSKGFSRKALLDTHVRSHTGERPFNCPFCLKTFACKRSFASHIKLHKLGGQTLLLKPDTTTEGSSGISESQQYNCKQCERIFTSEADLFLHVKDEHDLKPAQQSLTIQGFSCKPNQALTNSNSLTSVSLLRAQLSAPPQPSDQLKSTNEESVQTSQCLTSGPLDIGSDLVIQSEQTSEKFYFLVDASSPNTVSRVSHDELKALSIALPHVTFCSSEGTRLHGLGQEEDLHSSPRAAAEMEPVSQNITTSYQFCQNDFVDSAESLGTSDMTKAMTPLSDSQPPHPESVLTSDMGKSAVTFSLNLPPDPEDVVTSDMTKSNTSMSVDLTVHPGAFGDLDLTKPASPFHVVLPPQTISAVNKVPSSESSLAADHTLSTENVQSYAMYADGHKIFFKIIKQPLNVSEEDGSQISPALNKQISDNHSKEANLSCQSMNKESADSNNPTVDQVTVNQVHGMTVSHSSIEKCTTTTGQKMFDNPQKCHKQTEAEKIGNLRDISLEKLDNLRDIAFSGSEEFPDRTNTFAPIDLLKEFMPKRKSRRRSV